MSVKKQLLGILKFAFYGLFLIIIFYYLFFELSFRGRPISRQRHGNPPLTPPWALECWLWEDDLNTAARVDTLLNGYASNDIPVRTILLDSPWSLRYNDFKIDTVSYPEPEQWFSSLQIKGYRVVLWMTTMVNSSSTDTRIRDDMKWFRYAAEKGFLAGNGDQIKWWKGRGGFIDYSNPEAVKWWQGLQQTVFNYGIDGWKLDGTATLFFKMAGAVPLFFRKTYKGLMTTRSYMDHYYRDEYRHGLEENPEFVTLARSIDRGFHPEGFAPIDAAPVTWVGDQTHKWEPVKRHYDRTVAEPEGKDGIGLAMKNIIAAARTGYNIIGSDVAGFSGKEIPPELYIRWAEFSAFCGLFLNGGHGERALWKRSPEELSIIRKFSWLHTELVPYMYSYVVSAHSGGTLLQTPVKGKYHYLFGDNFLVAPICSQGKEYSVTLPAGRWRYFFKDSALIQGPVTFKRDFPLDEYPVYVKEGAIVPMDIKRDYTGIGDRSSEGYLTILVYPSGRNDFTVHHPDKSGSTVITSELSERAIKISFTGVHKPHILNVTMDIAPKKVELDGKVLSDTADYQYNRQRNKLIIKTNSYQAGEYLIYR